MTYQILNLVLTWCVGNIQTANEQLREPGEADVSQDYLQAQADLAFALKKVMKFN